MKCNRKFTVLLLAVASMAVLAFAQKSSQAQVVVYGGYGAYYGGYGVYAAPAYAPVYAAPVYAPAVYAAPWYATPTPVYAAPAPVAYGAYYAPYPSAAPIGYGLGYPVKNLEVKYKYRHGLWYVDIDD